MILTYTTDDFNSSNGVYYSPEFKIEKNDKLVTIECILNEEGSVIVQSKIDEEWYDIVDTDFICNPKGLQAYTDCQQDISYRLKSITEFNKTNILL